MIGHYEAGTMIRRPGGWSVRATNGDHLGFFLTTGAARRARLQHVERIENEEAD
jgi:hypothetical protein